MSTRYISFIIIPFRINGNVFLTDNLKENVSCFDNKASKVRLHLNPKFVEMVEFSKKELNL